MSDWEQKYVDANEALVEAIDALERVRAAKMPGESRVIATQALNRLRELPSAIARSLT